MAWGGGLWTGWFACDRPAHESVLSCVGRFTNLGNSSPSRVSFNQMVKRQNTEDLTETEHSSIRVNKAKHRLDQGLR